MRFSLELCGRVAAVGDTITVVQVTAAGHDRGTAVPDPGTGGGLASALERVRLDGALFLRGEFREPWAYRSMTSAVTAAALRPGADRVVLFHVVTHGALWVAGPDGERHWARAGDIIVLPYADQHTMGGAQAADVVPIETFLPRPPWAELPVVIRHGTLGEQSNIYCGYLYSADPLFDPRLRVFPPVFVVRPPPGPAAEFVAVTMRYAVERAGGVPDAVPARLPELLLVEVLKLHLATAPAATVGLLAALRDPVMAPALAAIHGRPEHKWTVEELARVGLVSRSLLDERFRTLLQCSPIRYLTDWRMHVAQDLLATTELSIAAVARRVGYDAEEAFSRAFKRAFGAPPSVWRVHRATAPTGG